MFGSCKWQTGERLLNIVELAMVFKQEAGSYLCISETVITLCSPFHYTKSRWGW